jgi:hypothetical protein
MYLIGHQRSISNWPEFPFRTFTIVMMSRSASASKTCLLLVRGVITTTTQGTQFSVINSNK